MGEGYERVTYPFGNRRISSDLSSFALLRMTGHMLIIHIDVEIRRNAPSQSSTINWDGGSGYVPSRVSGEPHDQAGDGSGPHPLRDIGARHSRAVGGSVHGAGQNYIGGDAGIFVFERDGADQRYQRRFGRAVGADCGAWVLGGTAADGDDAPASRIAHVWDNRPQDVKRAVDVHVEHALEGGVVSVGDGLASSEAANQVRQDVDLSEAGDDRVARFLGGGKTIERDGERGEVWVVEVGLLDSRGETDHGETGVQQGFCDVRSEAAVGSGDEGSFSRHRALTPTRTHHKCQPRLVGGSGDFSPIIA